MILSFCSCWAYGPVEQIESDAIRMLGMSKDTLRLSTQQVTSCDTSNGGCSGGTVLLHA